MSAASLFTALGLAAITAAVAIALAPVLSADMRRAVQRGVTEIAPDVTSRTLLAMGGGMLLCIPSCGLWLWSVWS